MVATPRNVESYSSSLVVPPGKTPMQFREDPSAKLAWMQLRQLTDDGHTGLALFNGTRREKNTLFNDLRNYVRQAKTYWDAASRTDGSAAALPLYYAMLNLAKAELLQTHHTHIVGKFIRHGLSMRASASASIRGDRLLTESGVFSLLYEKRVGKAIPSGTSLRVTNLLSLIPEIGHEMGQFGRARPPAIPAFHTVATNGEAAWSLILIESYPPLDRNESVTKALYRHYDEISLSAVPEWRQLFSLSSRIRGNWMALYQSKREFSLAAAGGNNTPDLASATSLPNVAFGTATATTTSERSEFLLTPSLTKTRPLALPLSLARYASTFYLSSLVRYKPSSLDPVRQGEQAWLMDSFIEEVSLNLLADATDGVTGKATYFEPQRFRV